MTFFNAILIALLAACNRPTFAEKGLDRPLPEFTHKNEGEWINSKPLTLAAVKGQVVLVDVWTFACWNCYRSFPWLNNVEKRYAGRLLIIGVHSPEFATEKIPANIRAKVKEFSLGHPVMIDTDFSYWNALGNQYWPAFYLVDKKGKIRRQFVGETHSGDDQAKEIERSIDLLLDEP